jgi:hypothetical protein
VSNGAKGAAHGQRVGDFDGADGGDLAAVGRVGFRVQQAFEGELHVVGGEDAAVVEGDALA